MTRAEFLPTFCWYSTAMLKPYRLPGASPVLVYSPVSSTVTLATSTPRKISRISTLTLVVRLCLCRQLTGIQLMLILSTVLLINVIFLGGGSKKGAAWKWEMMISTGLPTSSGGKSSLMMPSCYTPLLSIMRRGVFLTHQLEVFSTQRILQHFLLRW